jgi:hypothetical protein
VFKIYAGCSFIAIWQSSICLKMCMLQLINCFLKGAQILFLPRKLLYPPNCTCVEST